MIKLLSLFLEFFKIGLFTFGGGYAMIPIVHDVVTKGWITEELFQTMTGLAEITPGPIALNMATFVGVKYAGFLGGLFATVGVVLPSFIIICIVAALLNHFAENKYIKAALRGAIAVAIGLLISITVTMTFKSVTLLNANQEYELDLHMIEVLLFVVLGYITLWLTFNKKPSPIPTIGMSVLVGLILNLLGEIPTLIVFMLFLVLGLTFRKKS